MVDKRDQLARRFIIQATARGVLGRPVASEAIKRIDTTQANEQERQCEDDIWDPRLRRDVIFKIAGSMERPTCALLHPCEESYQTKGVAGKHPGTALSGQCSTIGEDRRSDSARDSSERIPSKCVVNGLVSKSQGYGRVVCPSMRKLLEKLKSLWSLNGLPGIEKGTLIEIVKGVLSLLDSPRGELQGDVAPMRSWRNSVIHLEPEQGLVH